MSDVVEVIPYLKKLAGYRLGHHMTTADEMNGKENSFDRPLSNTIAMSLYNIKFIYQTVISIVHIAACQLIR